MNFADAATKTRKGQSTTSKKVPQSAKAGLEFPINKVAHFLKKSGYADHVSAGAPVYLTAVLEYLMAEVTFIQSVFFFSFIFYN